MQYGAEGAGIIGLVIALSILLISICITIAPLIIWRNGNRTNRLLALIAVQVGVPVETVKETFHRGGGGLPPIMAGVNRYQGAADRKGRDAE